MAKSDQAKAREHRLAAKLRENLRRRKGAGKALADDGAATPEIEPERRGDTKDDKH